MLRFGGRAVLVVLLVLGGGSALAACLPPAEARAKVARGEAQPLAQVAVAAREKWGGGRVIRADLCEEGSGLVYRLTVITPDGRVWLVIADARSGRFLSAN